MTDTARYDMRPERPKCCPRATEQTSIVRLASGWYLRVPTRHIGDDGVGYTPAAYCPFCGKTLHLKSKTNGGQP